MICEVKNNFLKQIETSYTRKQMKKYYRLIQLLNSFPELDFIKNKLDIELKNINIFCIITNRDYQYFEYFLNLFGFNKCYAEDIHTEQECKDKSKLKKQFKILNLFNKKDFPFPFLILFIPKLFDSGSKPKYIKEIEKKIEKQDEKITYLEELIRSYGIQNIAKNNKKDEVKGNISSDRDKNDGKRTINNDKNKKNLKNGNDKSEDFKEEEDKKDA